MRNSSRLLAVALAFLATTATSCSRNGATGDAPRAHEESVDTFDDLDDLDLLLAEYEEDTGEDDVRLADPFKYWNVCWFYFNDRVYFWGVKPAAKAWGWIIYPRTVRSGIGNILENAHFPIRFINNAFQGKFRRTGGELTRFITNTTMGLGGLWDPADLVFGMKSYPEDFDQTLGRWGVGQGFYLVWPILGPSSPRGLIDTAVLGADPSRGLRSINDTSLGRTPYEEIRTQAVSPYAAIRDAYIQNRRKLVEE